MKKGVSNCNLEDLYTNQYTYNYESYYYYCDACLTNCISCNNWYECLVCSNTTFLSYYKDSCSTNCNSDSSFYN